MIHNLKGKKRKKQPTNQLCRCGEKRMCNKKLVTALELPKDPRIHRMIQKIATNISDDKYCKAYGQNKRTA